MKIYAGFDSGGTSTRCMLADEYGNVLGTGRSGPSNFLFCGREIAARSIRESLAEALKEAEAKAPGISGTDGPEIAGMFIASAAVEVFAGQDHAAFFQEVTGCPHVECDSDIFPVWYAGGKPRFAPAICTIAGTGAVTYLLSGRRFVKGSGWGPLFGDEGSGYDIGQKTLQLVSRMSDGREPMDRELYEAVLRHYGVDIEKPRRLLRAVNSPEDDRLGPDYRSRAASVTRVVDGLAAAGNEAATMLFRQAALDIVSSVKAVIRRSAHEDPYDYTDNDSGEDFALVLSGGLFREDSPLTREVKALLEGEKRILHIGIPKVSPEKSAVSIALYRAGLEEAAERLMEVEES